jgi:hypothetical protein
VKARGASSRLVLGAVVGVLGIVGVGATVVVAQSGDDGPETGSLDEIRYAQPARTSSPRTVAQGTTDAGQPYELRLSNADRQLCLEAEYGPYPGTASRDGDRPIARLLTSEVCVDPERAISASIGQLFVDPETGELTKRPQRFVYGIVADAATDVRLRSPGAAVRELRVTDVPGSDVKVFAGSAPRDAEVGDAVLVAENPGGMKIAEHELPFVGSGR